MFQNLAAGTVLVALTALEGINGFLIIGWSTVYLVRASILHGPFRAEHF